MLKQKKVLAIALKSKRLSFAVFFGERLIYYKSSGLVSNEKNVFEVAEEIFETAVRTYEPEYCALYALIYKQQRIGSITKLHEKVVRLAEVHKLSVKSYSPAVINRFFCPDTKTTKQKVFDALATNYPELKKYISSGARSRQSTYQQFLLKAVAVGLYCVKILSNNSKN
jgi:hypothetical protein